MDAYCIWVISDMNKFILLIGVIASVVKVSFTSLPHMKEGSAHGSSGSS